MMRGDEVLCLHLLQDGCQKYTDLTSLLNETLGQTVQYVFTMLHDDLSSSKTTSCPVCVLRCIPALTLDSVRGLENGWMFNR